jgi:hypothetical protein
MQLGEIDQALVISLIRETPIPSQLIEVKGF